MGSISAMNSIARVIARHGQEIRDEFVTPLRRGVAAAGGDPGRCDVELGNNDYSLVVYYRLGEVVIEGPSIDIDTLAERYPDCEVGY